MVVVLPRLNIMVVGCVPIPDAVKFPETVISELGVCTFQFVITEELEFKSKLLARYDPDCHAYSPPQFTVTL